VGVLYHFTQLIPETVIGLSVLGRGALGRTWRATRIEAASES
jgi:hypothetical protein